MFDSLAPSVGSARGALSESLAAQVAISTATTAASPLDAIFAGSWGDSAQRTTDLPDPTDFTMAGWFYLAANFDANDDWPVLFSLQGSGSFIQLYYYKSNGVWHLVKGASDGPSIGTLPTEEWFFCAVRSSGGSIDMRLLLEGETELDLIDGTSDGTGAPSFFALLTSANSRAINAAAYRCFVWDAGISDTDLLDVAITGNPNNTGLLRYWWPLEDATDNTDLSGNSFPPTFVGIETFDSNPAFGVTVTIGGIGTAETFGAASVAGTASQSVGPSGVMSSETFGSALLSHLVQSIVVSGIVTTEAFGNAGVAIAAISAVTPSGVASLEAFDSPVLGGAVAPGISPYAVASAEAFGAMTVNGMTQSITTASIASLETFGAATVNLAVQVVSPAGLASALAFGSVVIAGGVPVNPGSDVFYLSVTQPLFLPLWSTIAAV